MLQHRLHVIAFLISGLMFGFLLKGSFARITEFSTTVNYFFPALVLAFGLTASILMVNILSRHSLR